MQWLASSPDLPDSNLETARRAREGALRGSGDLCASSLAGAPETGPSFGATHVSTGSQIFSSVVTTLFDTLIAIFLTIFNAVALPFFQAIPGFFGIGA